VNCPAFFPGSMKSFKAGEIQPSSFPEFQLFRRRIHSYSLMSPWDVRNREKALALEEKLENAKRAGRR